MPTATIHKSYALPGYASRQATITRAADHAQVFGGDDAPITLNAAKAVLDFTEGAPNEATCNLAAGHGLTTGVYDVYWTESGVNKIRYGVANTIAVNACTLTSGAGDDYPATIADGLCVICKETVVSSVIDGDEVSVFWAVLDFGNVSATGRGSVAFEESDDTAVGQIDVDGVVLGVAIAEYDITGGVANPITGNVVDKCNVSHNDTTYTPTFEMAVLADSTP